MVPPGLALAFPAIVLAAALIIDRTFGDPQTPFHPVALLGRFIGWWGVPSCYPPRFQRFAGVLFWFCTILVFILPFLLLSRLLPWYIYLLCAPFLLKCCFAWRALEDHARAVAEAVGDGLEAGREKVKLLVSRDTAALDREQILSAAYESATENLTDSIVSPLLFYALFGIAGAALYHAANTMDTMLFYILFGIAGAALYRAANTMDAMLGYRDERERLGWFSARMDDVFNYLPARFAALFLLLYFAARGRLHPAWAIVRRDGKNRPGFNGGIVMAAMAGGIGIRFEKPGVYIIGDSERSLQEGGQDILRAVRAVALMGAVAAALIATGTVLLLGSWINNIAI